MRRLLAFALMLPVLAGSPTIAQTATPVDSGQFLTLDHVVAVINGDVLLQSDVEEEVHFAALEPFRPGEGKDTRQDAMRRLIDRTLIVQQMQEQHQFNISISDAQVETSLKGLRARLPQCAKYKCKTAAGWKAFLAANDLTEPEVTTHWKQRMVILRFIDVRFETGIRISQESIQSYYEKTVAPVFEKQHVAAPPLKDVRDRIQQVLLEQQVNGMLQDWLASLREEGSVRIVDPAYASVAQSTSATSGNEEEQEQ